MNAVGMMLSAKPKKKRWTQRPLYVVTPAVDIAIAPQAITTAPIVRPRWKRWKR